MSSRNKAPMPGDKKLKVQTNVVRRMLKEVSAYEKEVLENEKKVQKMRDDGKDEYDIKKQEEVLAESYMMVPDSKNRLEAAVQELQSCIDQIDSEDGIEEASIVEAKSILNEASLKFQS